MDWASLAQQWIKMKETTSTMPPGQQGGSTTSEANLLRPSHPIIDQQIPSNVTASNKTFTDHNVANPITGQ